jgi:enoyl-CoA hydratase/carnithine racemase
VPGAKAFYPVMKLGFLPQPSDPPRLAALVGPSRAKMVLMAGQKIDTKTALNWGLFDHVAEADTLLKTAHDLAADTVAADPSIAKGIKSFCHGTL